MPVSRFHKRFTEEAGIARLMDDLGDAQDGQGRMLMLGGGNPAHIPQVLHLFQKRFAQIADNPQELARVIGDYDPPQGNRKFIEALAKFFRRQYGWRIGPENIALTAGSQTAFYMLFNMFCGEFDDGSHRKILLPMVPEYIGYADVCHADDVLIAKQPLIETFANNEFKYHIDFDRLELTNDVGAICISRPTNPSGNVISDEELDRLILLSGQGGLPLIVDNAYGLPFPGIIYTAAGLRWEDHMVLCMSLSKLGLPGVRTGVVIANEQVIASLARMNAIFSLAPGGTGPALAAELVEKNAGMPDLCNQVIRPYYQHKADAAMTLLKRELAGIDYYIHKPEGAFFLWLWVPDLPGGCEQLYRRLKARSVLIVPGHYFFPGLTEDWPHRSECIRISYAMNEQMVEQGILIIADEVRKTVRGECKE